MSTNTATIKIAVDVDGKTGVATIRQIGDESRKAGGKAEKGFKDSKKSLGDFNDQAEKSIFSVGKMATAFGALAATAALGGVVALLKDGVESMAEWERRLLRTEALIRATGGAAGYTADELEEFANQLDLATLGDRDEILDAINAMQTFRDVTGETFTRSIKLSQDLSEVLGTGLRSQVVQLGKALQDPVQGLTALRRVGVQFTEDQEEMIKELVESNQKLEAQAKILDEIERQVGGAAQGAAAGLSGKMDTLTFRWREFKEVLSETSGAASLTASAIDTLARSLEHMSSMMQPKPEDYFSNAIAGLESRLKIYEGLGGSENERTEQIRQRIAALLSDLNELPLAAERSIAQQRSAFSKNIIENVAASAKPVKELEKQMDALAKSMAEYMPDAWDPVNFDVDYGGFDDLTVAIQALQQAENNRRIDLQKSIEMQNALAEAVEDTYDIDIGPDSFSQDMAKMNAEFQALENDANAWSDAMSNAFTGWASSYSRTLNDMLWDSELTFDGILESFGRMLTQMMIQQGMTGLATSTLSLFTSARGNVFSGPGIAAYENRILDRPTVIPLARGAALVAEAGRSEAVMPLTRMPNNDLGVAATMAAPIVEINIANESGLPVEQGPVIMQQSADRVVANMVIKRKMTSRSFRQSLRS